MKRKPCGAGGFIAVSARAIVVRLKSAVVWDLDKQPAQHAAGLIGEIGVDMSGT